MKFSIIIPAYQAGLYLEKCIKSVLDQTWKDLEIILVDDGSTDSTPELCDSFSKEHANVHVIHQENRGLSEARNTGINAAVGDYILFLDSDDFWNNNDALLQLADRLNNSQADVLNFSYLKYYEDTDELEAYFNNVPEMPLSLKTEKEKKEYLTVNQLYIASACNKAIKRELLLDESLRFRKGVYSEDIEWCLKLLCKSKTPDFICENFYCYRQRKGSITKTIDNRKCSDLCNNILNCIAICYDLDPGEQEAAFRYTAYQFGTFFKVQAQAAEFQEEGITKLSPECGILRFHSGNKKLKLLNLGCKILGMKKLCRMIRLCFRLLNKREFA